MTTRLISSFAISALFTVALACSSEDPDPNNAGGAAGNAGTAGSAGTSGTAGTAGTGGGTGNDPIPVGQNPQVSECGGFQANTRDALPYCDAELLRWSYDSSSKTLSLLNQRVFLNCCGEHNMTVTFDPDRNVYTVTETDAPVMFDGSGARCGCMCVFDWVTDATGVEPGNISVELVRHVTDDSAGSQVIWNGQLDLSEVQGEVVIDDVPLDFGCDTAME